MGNLILDFFSGNYTDEDYSIDYRLGEIENEVSYKEPILKLVVFIIIASASIIFTNENKA